MKRQSQGLKHVILQFAYKFLTREFEGALKRWRRGLRGKQVLEVLELFAFTALSMYVLWHWAFGQSFMFGIFFTGAAILATLRGHILTHPLYLLLLALAVVIGSLVIPDIREDAWQALRRGDVMGAVVLMGVVLFLGRWKEQLQTGQVGNYGTKPYKRRRRSRRR